MDTEDIIRSITETCSNNAVLLEVSVASC